METIKAIVEEHKHFNKEDTSNKLKRNQNKSRKCDYNYNMHAKDSSENGEKKKQINHLPLDVMEKGMKIDLRCKKLIP